MAEGSTLSLRRGSVNGFFSFQDLTLEYDSGEGRKCENDGVGARLPEHRTAGHRLIVENATTAVALVIAIEQLVIDASVRDAQAIAVARNGCKITNEYQRILPLVAAAHKGNDAIL